MIESQLPDTLNGQWKNDKTRFGYRMLSKFGWTEDKGLGKSESGIRQSIKVSRREEGSGIGAKEESAGTWTEHTTSFNSILQELKQNYKTVKKTKKSKIIHVGIK